MSKPVPVDQVSFTPTLADTLAAYRLHSLRPWRILVYAAIYGALFAGIGLVFKDTPQGLATAFGIGFAAMWLLWLLGIVALLPWRVRRIFRQQASLRQEHVVGWSEAGLSVHTANVDATIPWGDYIGRKENTALILIYHSDALFQFIPTRTLDPAGLASLRPYLDRLPPKR